MSDKQRRFTYTARDLNGEVRSGALLADSESRVSSRLQAMGLVPISVRPVGGNTGFQKPFQRRNVRAKDLASIARQFATMSNSGLPLVRALAAVTEQTENVELQRVLPMVRAEVEAGSAFSVALSRHPRVFPPLMTAMVAAGEQSGSLGAAMSRVADNYEAEARLRSKVVAALIYPVIVMCMAVVMVGAMLLFVVPTFQSVFTGLGGELPLPTRILITTSEAFRFIGPVLAVVAVIFTVWWRRHKNDERVRTFVDPVKFRIPIMGKFFKKIALTRFSRTFSALLSSGVPMLQAIEMTARTTGNIILTRALLDVRESVRAGRPLAGPMAQQGVFPSLVTQMIATGEETGEVPSMLDKVADFYQMEVDTTADALTSVLEPILIVLLALVVGSMVISLYLPMFSVFDLIR